MASDKAVTDSNNLGINSLLRAAENFQARPAPKPMPKQKNAQKPFIRVKYIPNKTTGKPYYYEVTNYIDGQGRRRQWQKYLGARKPRGYRPK